MNRITTLAAFVGGSLLGASLLSAADETAEARRKTVNDTTHRSTEIAGMTVKNSNGEELGEIDDIVIDVTSGQVTYLALSHGGILGINDKKFAIPADLFQLRPGEEDGEYFLTLPVDRRTLESAPGFDEDTWPDLADRAWRDKVDAHFDKYRRSDASRVDSNVRAGDSRVDVKTGDRREHQSQRSAAVRRGDITHRTSEIRGMTVKDRAGEEIGEVNDVVIDLERGEVRYLAVSYGGVLGLGDKLFAVPVDAFDCRRGDEDDEYFLVLNVEEKTWKQAPGFDEETWPDFGNEHWRQENDRHYRDGEANAQRERAEQRRS